LYLSLCGQSLSHPTGEKRYQRLQPTHPPTHPKDFVFINLVRSTDSVNPRAVHSSGVGQERLGPSYFFISLVLGPLNSLVWYVPSLRHTCGLSWRIHCGVEVPESSTNKQQHRHLASTPPLSAFTSDTGMRINFCNPHTHTSTLKTSSL
jgi:hypothetical protein